MTFPSYKNIKNDFNFRKIITENQQIITNKLETELLKKLLALYSDEWLAVYQYSIESDFISNLNNKNKISTKVKNQITKELDIHTMEEFKHAKLLVPEILKLDGTIIDHIDKLSKNANADFIVPIKNETTILHQAIQSEEGAIKAYTETIKFITQFKDNKFNTLTELLKKILDQEYEHKTDLEKIIKDIKGIKG